MEAGKMLKQQKQQPKPKKRPSTAPRACVKEKAKGREDGGRSDQAPEGAPTKRRRKQIWLDPPEAEGQLPTTSHRPLLNHHHQEEEEEEVLVDVERLEEELEAPLEAGTSGEQEKGLELADIPGKSRRDKEKNGFTALSQLLPLSPPIRDQLDKCGILRISIAFLQLHELLSRLMGYSNIAEMPLEQQQLKTTEANKEARHRRRQWAMARRGRQEPLRQFAFSLFQAMDGFAIVLNHQGQVVYVNETVAVHLGLCQIELVGNVLSDFLHPADVQMLREKLALFVEANVLRVLAPELHFILRFRCAPGRRMWAAGGSSAGIRGMGGFKPIHFTGTLWPDNDGRFIGFGQPMVAYGQSELRLTSSMFVFRATPALQLIFVDNRFISVSGHAPNALLDHSLYALIHPKDTELVAEMHQTALDQGLAQSALFRLIAARGGHFWVQCRLCLIQCNRLSYTSNLSQLLVGICSVVSEIEHGHQILDSAQKDWHLMDKLKGDEGKQEDEEEQSEESGPIGHYSSKFYQGGQAVDSAVKVKGGTEG